MRKREKIRYLSVHANIVFFFVLPKISRKKKEKAILILKKKVFFLCFIVFLTAKMMT